MRQLFAFNTSLVLWTAPLLAFVLAAREWNTPAAPLLLSFALLALAARVMIRVGEIDLRPGHALHFIGEGIDVSFDLEAVALFLPWSAGPGNTAATLVVRKPHAGRLVLCALLPSDSLDAWARRGSRVVGKSKRGLEMEERGDRFFEDYGK